MTVPRTRTGPSDVDRLFTGKDGENPRVKSGISELDEMLRGGFMEGDAVLLAGSAGTGKTTMALQHLVNGITRFGEPGVYVTFEELPDQIYRDAGNFGWDLRRLEEENKFRLVCTSPNLLLESGAESVLEETVKEVRAKRIAIDSLSHLAMYVPENQLRQEAYRLVRHLKTRGLSSLLLWEVHQTGATSFAVTEIGLSFLVDCIVVLKPVEIESSMRKAILVQKMRGSDHDKRLREFEITSSGIKITSAFSDYEGIMTGSPRRVASEKFVELFRRTAEKSKAR